MFRGMPTALVIAGLCGVILAFVGAVLMGIGATTPDTDDPDSARAKRAVKQRAEYMGLGGACLIVGAGIAVVCYIGERF